MSYPRLVDDRSIWVMVAPSVIWAAHFLLCYWIAAIWCAKAAGGGSGPLQPVAWAVAGVTALALGLIWALARHAWRRYGGSLFIGRSIAEDRAEDRKRFLGHVALLLCVLNTVAVIFTALPVLVFDRCW